MSKNKNDDEIVVSVSDDFVAVVPTSFSFAFGANFACTIGNILETETDIFSDICEAAGFNKEKDYIGVNYKGLDFSGSGSYFDGVNFRNANLRETMWDSENTLNGSLLNGADFTGSIGLTEEMLAGAYIDETTILPDYINRARVKELHDKKGLPAPKPIGVEKDGVITIPVPATLHRKQ